MDICTKIYFNREKELKYQKLFSIKEYDSYIESNKLDITEVIAKLYEKDSLVSSTLISEVDIIHNLHKDL